MSNKYLNWAWNLSLKPGPKLVLICLADMCNDSGYCWPKQSTIADKTGFNRSTVNRHVSYLEELKIVQQVRQRYRDGRLRSSAYQLNEHQDFLPCADLQHAEMARDQVVFQHNRIHQVDPLLIGGVH